MGFPEDLSVSDYSYPYCSDAYLITKQDMCAVCFPCVHHSVKASVYIIEAILYICHRVFETELSYMGANSVVLLHFMLTTETRPFPV